MWGDLVLQNGFLEYTVYSENREFVTVKYGDDNVHVFFKSPRRIHVISGYQRCPECDQIPVLQHRPFCVMLLERG